MHSVHVHLCVNHGSKLTIPETEIPRLRYACNHQVVQAVVHKTTGDDMLFYKFHPSAPLGDKAFYGPWSDEARSEPELFTSFKTVTFEKIIKDFQVHPRH